MENKTNTKGGAKEVTTPKNGMTTKTAGGKTTPPKAEEKKAEPKQEPTAPKVVELPPKPKTIEEELKHFEGLEKLIRNRRILAKHLTKINSLEIDDEDLLEFENTKNDWIKIELMDRDGENYEIDAPVLVRELHLDLIKRVESKIAMYDQKILAYTHN